MTFWQVVGAVVLGELIYDFANSFLGAVYEDILKARRTWRR